MTANHAHTPTTEVIRETYIGEPPYTLYGYTEAEFDRWLATVEAAAEQRGAIKALRDAAGAIEKNNIVFDGDHYQPCNSCMSIHMNWLDYRADQMEGDDE